MKFENICIHYNNIIRQSDEYDSVKPIRNTDLLLPEFYNTLVFCFNEYQKKYPSQRAYITESYRSNSLQLKYYKTGKSKIRKNGMHHYGIAADVAFIINDKLSYKGDYNYLRKIFKENNLTVLDWELGHVQFIPVSEQSALREEIENSV
ncbi:MAG: hypothetical protein HY959_00495 [Ignavibacteriae bacterium]|nr:hypothetical protein [Ignavibacteriota bacterium]